MFNLYIVVLCAVVFTCLASYFTALIMRGEHLTEAHGSRSECDKCFHVLAWYDLIPLVSFLSTKGKCRYCGKPVDRKLFIAEGLAAIYGAVFGLFIIQNFLIVINLFNVVELLVIFIVGVLLLYLAIYDLLTYTVPTAQLKWALGVAVSGNILFAIFRYLSLYNSLLLGNMTNLLAAVIASLFLIALIVLTRNRGMGQGDVLIAAIIGMLLGLTGLLAGFYVMLLSASLFGIAYSIRMNKFKGLLIPLVPFMSLGFFLALTWGPQIVNILFPTF